MMGGGGFMSHMNNVIRDNRALLRKKRLFKSGESFSERRKMYLKATAGKINSKTYSKAELREIKIIIRKEFRKERFKSFLFGSLLIILGALFLFKGFEYIINTDREFRIKNDQIELENRKKEFDFLISDAKMWKEKGNLHNAIYQYEKALELFPNHKELNQNLKSIYRQQCQTKGKYCDKVKNQ